MGFFDSTAPAPAQQQQAPPPPSAQQTQGGFFGGAAHQAAPPAPQTYNPMGGTTMGKPSAAAGADSNFFSTLGAQHSGEQLGRIHTATSKALDAQGWAVRKALTGESDTDKQMTKIRHAIPGMDWLYGSQGNQPILHTGFGPLDSASQSITNTLHHAAQGLTDAAIQGGLDPLTLETAFMGPAMKGVGGALMANADRNVVTRGITHALKASSAVKKAAQHANTYFDWEAPAAKAGYDPSVIHGGANAAGYEGSRLQSRVMENVHHIINGKDLSLLGNQARKALPALTDEERLNVQRALHGEIDQTPTGNVYHGSPQEGLTRILSRPQNRQWDNATSQLGAFVATTPEAASRYGKNIYRADLQLKNPYEMPFREFNYLQSPNKAADGSSLAGEGWGARSEELKGEAAQIRQRLEAEGHDGIIVRNSKGEPIEMASFSDIPLPQGKLTLREQVAARQLRHLTEFDYNSRRAWGKQLLQEQHPEMKPDELEAKLDEEYPKRENYMPQPFSSKTEGREAFKTSPAHHYDPHNLPQQEFLVNDPADLERGFQSMASNLGRQKTTAFLHELFGKEVLENPEIDKMLTEFVPATGNKRAFKDYFRENWLKTIGYPRAAVVSILPRHDFNIGDLAANTIPVDKWPQAIKEVGPLVVKLLKAGPREYAELTKEWSSAIGGAFTEKQPFFQKFPDWLSKDREIGAHLAGKPIPILSKWAYFNNKLVWATDAAFKIIYAKIMKQAGEAAAARGAIPEGMGSEQAENLRAGGLSSKRLIDYEHRSQFQNHLRYIAPFGTFRGGVPGAALGGMIRNPARAAFLSRATAGAFTGDRPENSGSPGLMMSNPTADVGRLFDWNQQTAANGKTYPVSGPAQFAEATLGNVPSAALGLGMDVIAPDKLPIAQNPLAYGQTWLPKRGKDGKLDLGFIADQALAGVPQAGAFLQAMGLSRFQWKGLSHELIRQGTGVQY